MFEGRQTGEGGASNTGRGVAASHDITQGKFSTLHVLTHLGAGSEMRKKAERSSEWRKEFFKWDLFEVVKSSHN